VTPGQDLLAVYIDLFTPLVSSETATLICANAASQATQNSPGDEEYRLATYCEHRHLKAAGHTGHMSELAVGQPLHDALARLRLVARA